VVVSITKKNVERKIAPAVVGLGFIELAEKSVKLIEFDANKIENLLFKNNSLG
jgi:hypothetical protein